jgi:hypothetical protein
VGNSLGVRPTPCTWSATTSAPSLAVASYQIVSPALAAPATPEFAADSIVEEAAEDFGVSAQMMRWRLNATGAYKRAQRTRGSSAG